MPTHVDIICGDYEKVLQGNILGRDADVRYVDYCRARKYPLAAFYTLYRCHNLHFLTYGAMFDGQYATPYIMPSTPALFSVGARVAHNGYAFIWLPQRIQCFITQFPKPRVAPPAVRQDIPYLDEATQATEASALVPLGWPLSSRLSEWRGGLRRRSSIQPLRPIGCS